MADCALTKIAVMQLFYELKQKFPTIPDQFVSHLMQQAAYNKEECEKRLSKECRRYQVHSYPSDIVDKMAEGKERPKTLSLFTGDSNVTGLFGRHSQKSFQIEEECKRQGLVDGDDRVAELDGESVQNFEISSNQHDLYVSDLRLQFQNDNCGRGQTNFCVKYERDSQSAPSTPSSNRQKSIGCDSTGGVGGVRKHRSILNVDRSVKSPMNTDCVRPITGVKMTMRPPSTEPLPPIKISTDGSGSSNLVYVTTSSGASSGYQNQLQISINDNGNTMISASRTRNTSIIPNQKVDAMSQSVDDGLPDLLTAFSSLSTTSELRLREQVERKQRLETELERERKTLAQKKQEVKTMEEDLKRRRMEPFISQKVIVLRAEVAALSDECRRMEEFINRTRQRPHVSLVQSNNNDSANWTCRMCTFKNHPTLPKCEQCDMARVNLRNVHNNIMRLNSSRPVGSIGEGIEFNF